MDAQIFTREENLRTAFAMFDKDNSGKIDTEEIKALLEGDEYKDQIDKEQIMKAIKDVDENGDGEIDYEEFLAMMRKMT
jgi:calcium-dependent protein kinase